MKWQIKFRKEIVVEVDAPTEHEALVKALATDLDALPLDWEIVNDPVMEEVEPEEDLLEVPLDRFSKPM